MKISIKINKNKNKLTLNKFKKLVVILLVLSKSKKNSSYFADFEQISHQKQLQKFLGLRKMSIQKHPSKIASVV